MNFQDGKLKNIFWLRPAYQRYSWRTNWRSINKSPTTLTLAATMLLLFLSVLFVSLSAFTGWIDLVSLCLWLPINFVKYFEYLTYLFMQKLSHTTRHFFFNSLLIMYVFKFLNILSSSKSWNIIVILVSFHFHHHLYFFFHHYFYCTRYIMYFIAIIFWILRVQNEMI